MRRGTGASGRARALGVFGLALACAVLAQGARPGVAHEGPCRGVTCSGHGTCMVEREVPFCLCEEGYAASGVTCARASVPDTAARRRSASTAGQIVYLASRESQRGPQWVGRAANGEGDALSTYVAPGELWCSDFVSWIYRGVGVPFTGGYDGGWRLSNNQAIRAWFQRRGLWIDRLHPEWSTFVPQPGDYLRFHTESGHGHSGIVRYTSPSDVLYTVEGNVSNVVRQRRYFHFREHPRLDGFGVVVRPR